MTKDTRLNLTHKLLVALPSMADSLFEKSVIFICHHDADGAMGLIINKPKGDVIISDILLQIGIDGDIAVADSHILDGGPVDIDRGFVLHSDDMTLKSKSAPMIDGVCLSSSKDALETLVSNDDAPSQALLAVGYSGWSGGQLEREIQANAWIIAESNSEIIFSGQHDEKWAQAIRSLGIDPNNLSAIGGTA